MSQSIFGTLDLRALIGYNISDNNAAVVFNSSMSGFQPDGPGANPGGRSNMTEEQLNNLKLHQAGHQGFEATTQELLRQSQSWTPTQKKLFILKYPYLSSLIYNGDVAE